MNIETIAIIMFYLFSGFCMAMGIFMIRAIINYNKRLKIYKEAFKNIEADMLDEVTGLNCIQKIAVGEFIKDRTKFL